MNSSTIMPFLIALWCIKNVAEAGPNSNMKKALFFDYKLKELVEIDKSNPQAKYSSFISACPSASDSKREKILNENVSVTGNGIFLRQLYQDDIYAKDVGIEICEEPPTPALVWDRQAADYEIGYELYYEEDQDQEKEVFDLKFPFYRDFYKVTKGVPSPKNSPDKNVIIIEDGREETKFQIIQYPGKPLVFYWIPIFSIGVLADESRHRRMIYFTKDAINDYFHNPQIISNCEFYYSGDGRKIFDATEEIVDQKSDEILVENSEMSEQQTNRLVKTQIIPMLVFHTHSARLATCMYLNFAFVWETIANGQLKEIDLFLYSMYRQWPSEINILYGVTGQLEVDKSDEIASEDELFQKFAIPEVIYRVVYYNWAPYDSNIYRAVVVIHNDPNEIPEDRRICPVKDELQGWNDIKNTNYKTGFSYVCRMTIRVNEKLRLGDKDRVILAQSLELNNFPHLDPTTKQTYHQDVIGQVRENLDYIKKLKNSV